jgi:hypothetical protein
MKHIWTVLCKESIIDTESNNISLLNVLEQISIGINDSNGQRLLKEGKMLNLNVIPFEIVSFWAKEDSTKPEEADMIIEFLDPKGNKIKEFEQHIIITAQYSRIRTRIKINGLSVKDSGTYNFTIRIKDKAVKNAKIVAEIPLEINIGILIDKK